MGEREKQYKGSISYNKLWLLLEQKGMKKRDLRELYNISPTIVNRLNNNTNVAVDTIMYLCEILNCQPGDIFEYLPPESNSEPEKIEPEKGKIDNPIRKAIKERRTQKCTN